MVIVLGEASSPNASRWTMLTCIGMQNFIKNIPCGSKVISVLLTVDGRTRTVIIVQTRGLCKIIDTKVQSDKLHKKGDCPAHNIERLHFVSIILVCNFIILVDLVFFWLAAKAASLY